MRKKMCIRDSASTPEAGKNALTALLTLVSRLPLADCPQAEYVKKLVKLFPHGDVNGKALGIDMKDDLSGEMTVAFSMLKIDEGSLDGTLDVYKRQVVDSVIVGQFLGVNALAAVGSTGSVVFLVWGLVTGLTSGFSVILAQQFGAGDKKGLCRYEGASVWLCGVIGILMTVILMLGLNPILRLMNTPDEIFGETRAYLGAVSYTHLSFHMERQLWF